MNAKNYLIKRISSPLDFPAVNGLVQSSVTYHSEPVLNNNKVLLTITKAFALHNVGDKEKHEVFSVQSDYEIPVNEIKSREDVYEFYKDALLGLDEAYKNKQTQIPMLPSRAFPNEPIESYNPEIDRVFNLLIRLN